ncbi:symmetrical bis(5'-nucleosyl)-tetraphosphatase [Deltaproteobacteria bacterium PRO3]|nr:symmetrical bis(5'-nucleosyl)-tetraphosphatase [Deltaproteobacteria bacterium PRO3]
MSTYAIGDIQGCFLTLQRLLERIAFDPARDRLWLVGDLVNRGPRSLEVLRWARGLGESVVAVLGNHDLHLLARAAGVTHARRRDSLEQVLQAADREDLLDWLRHRPLLHREGDHALVHGGLDPSWTLEESEGLAREAEAALRGPRGREALAAVYAGRPERWEGSATGTQRLQSTLHILTRIRVCHPDGRIDFAFKGEPEAAPEGFLPWYEIPGRKSRGATLVFGHWAALGLRLMPGALALDSGCAWGRELSALRLEDRAVFQQPCLDLTTS